MAFLNKNKYYFLLLVALTVFLFFFALTFGFHTNNDTEGYIGSIQFFRGKEAEIYPNRYLNPLYPLVAGEVLFFLSPEKSLIFLNLVFYAGLVFLTYGLCRRVFKNDLVGFVSALVVMTAYPMVRYALTQVQDMGGYFWFVATLYGGWRWWENKDDWRWITVAGVSTAFGLLTKESGAMAAIFVGILILVGTSSLSNKALQLLNFSLWPFVTLVINKFRGVDVGYDSISWFVDNWRIYSESNYHFIKWLGVNASTFNVVWIFFGIGSYFVIRNWSKLSRDVKVFLIAVLPSSLSYFAWPLFISRTVFISAWFIVPIAVYGFYNLFSSSRRLLKVCAVAGLLFMIVFPSLLQYTLRYAHVFKIYEDCNKKIVCSWNYFWTHRSEFSKES